MFSGDACGVRVPTLFVFVGGAGKRAAFGVFLQGFVVLVPGSSYGNLRGGCACVGDSPPSKTRLGIYN